MSAHTGTRVFSPWALVVITSIILAGCSSENDSNLAGAAATHSTPSSTTADATDSPNVAAPAVLDESELAESLLLRLEFLPSGWVEQVSDDTEQNDDSLMAECGVADLEGVTGQAETGDFSRNTTTLKHYATVFSSSEVARNRFGYDEDRLLCVTRLISDGALDTDEVEFTNASLGRTSFTSTAEQVAGYQIKFTVRVLGETGPFSSVQGYYDLVAFQTDRVIHSVMTSDVLTPFSAFELTEIVDGIVGRVPSELSEE